MVETKPKPIKIVQKVFTGGLPLGLLDEEDRTEAVSPEQYGEISREIKEAIERLSKRMGISTGKVVAVAIHTMRYKRHNRRATP